MIQHSRWLAHLGDGLYQLALWLNHHFNRLRHRMGLHYWSLSQYLKHKVKNAVSFITDFEEALAGEARRRGADTWSGAELRDVGGILYCNDGDWVESLSALAKPTASCSCWTGPPSRPSIRPGARPIRPAASRARYRCRRCRRRCAARANTRDNPYTSRYATGMLQFTPLGHACSWATGERPVHAATCSQHRAMNDQYQALYQTFRWLVPAVQHRGSVLPPLGIQQSGCAAHRHLLRR